LALVAFVFRVAVNLLLVPKLIISFCTTSQKKSSPERFA
jgi:hypothetical protein